MTKLLKTGTKCFIETPFRKIIGTIQGNDFDNSENIESVNYYFVEDGKTFDDEVMVLREEITIL